LTNRRMRARMSGGVRGGGATPPPTRFSTTAKFGNAERVAVATQPSFLRFWLGQMIAGRYAVL
jgi:hypothetical protein